MLGISSAGRRRAAAAHLERWQGLELEPAPCIVHEHARRPNLRIFHGEHTCECLLVKGFPGVAGTVLGLDMVFQSKASASSVCIEAPTTRSLTTCQTGVSMRVIDARKVQARCPSSWRTHTRPIEAMPLLASWDWLR